MDWEDIDNTYLDESKERIMAMIPLALAMQPNPVEGPVQVIDYIDPNLTPPFFLVYLGQPNFANDAYDLHRQVWQIVIRYVIGYKDEGYDGNLQRTVYIFMPKLLNYFRSHLNLVYLTDEQMQETEQRAPKYLDVENVLVTQASAFGLFENERHVGIEIAILLPFTIPIEQEWL